jgi:single-stranded DNA-binding protein
MSKAAITVEAFVANELEVRDAGGHRVVDVSLPHTPSRKNAQTGEWEDAGPTTWFSATFWDEHADEVLRSVQKGSYVIVSGFPEVEAYKKRDGEPGAKITIKFPTLAAVIRRPARNVSATTSGAPAAAGADDVWNTPAAYDDQTPF